MITEWIGTRPDNSDIARSLSVSIGMREWASQRSRTTPLSPENRSPGSTRLGAGFGSVMRGSRLMSRNNSTNEKPHALARYVPAMRPHKHAGPIRPDRRVAPTGASHVRSVAVIIPAAGHRPDSAGARRSPSHRSMATIWPGQPEFLTRDDVAKVISSSPPVTARSSARDSAT